METKKYPTVIKRCTLEEIIGETKQVINVNTLSNKTVYNEDNEFKWCGITTDAADRSGRP